jgi:hypothetical protein
VVVTTLITLKKKLSELQRVKLLPTKKHCVSKSNATPQR